MFHHIVCLWHLRWAGHQQCFKGSYKGTEMKPRVPSMPGRKATDFSYPSAPCLDRAALAGELSRSSGQPPRGLLSAVSCQSIPRADAWTIFLRADRTRALCCSGLVGPSPVTTCCQKRAFLLMLKKRREITRQKWIR